MPGRFLKTLARKLKKYRLDRSGSIALAFALALPIVIGAVGASLDMGQAYLVKQRLGAALDASALAGAAMATDEDEIRAHVQEFFDLNYPPSKIGTTYDLNVRVEGEDIIVSAQADFFTAFLHVLGIEKFTIYEQAIVVREVRGLEVVLVLDVTGSMSTNNNIRTLRDAATNFVNILFDRTSDPEAIKIGLVPYSTSVNVGSYGVGRNPDGSLFVDGDDVGRPFVVNLDGSALNPSYYTTNATRGAPYWYGCVVENNPDGWRDDINNNDPYPNDVIKMREDEDPLLKILDHEGPWHPYMYENYASNDRNRCGRTCDRNGRNCRNNSCHYVNARPATNCNGSTIVPLTSDRDRLLSAIRGFTAAGNTMGNIGMTWGYRVLSPEFPFQQGAAWDDIKWRKVVIMMTDGVNTMDANYSAYWRTRRHRLTTTHQNQRFLETCNQMKAAKGVLIYTVTFAGGVDNNTKNYYRQCATSAAQYYDAPSQAELIDVFETISRELANLHLRN